MHLVQLPEWIREPTEGFRELLEWLREAAWGRTGQAGVFSGNLRCLAGLAACSTVSPP